MLSIKPPKWNVFSSPIIKPVQYHSLYTEKEKFYDLIEEYDAQVFQPGSVHYSCIIPKHSNSRFCRATDLFILFFSETLDSSCIGFRIKVRKDKIFNEANFLAKFLKEAGVSICSKMKNSLIHVKCKTISNAWNLFYCLYEAYLRQYVSTVIGTQSFNSFLYSNLIGKEKLLLEMLCMGSKIVNISKKSIFYKIHKKRKLSVTDIINTYTIMPSFKKFAMGSLRSKRTYCKHRKSYVSCPKIHSIVQKKNVIIQEIVPISGVSQNIFRKSEYSNCGQTQFLPLATRKLNQQHQITQKRKFDEIENDTQLIVPFPSTYKSSKFHENNLKKDSWKIFRNFRSDAIKCYFDIPQIKNVASSLYKKSLEQNHDFVTILKNNDFRDENQTSNKIVGTSSVVKYTYNMDTGVKSQQQNDYGFTFGTNAPAPKKKECLANFSTMEYLGKSPLPGIAKCIEQKYESPMNCDSKEKNLNVSCDIGFTSAKGKTISIPNKSIMAVQNLFQDVLFSSEPQTSKDGIISTCYNKTNEGNFKKDACEYKKSAKTTNYQLSKKCNMQYSKMDCKIASELNEDFKSIGFSTAAGKSISLSQKSMLAAQRIFEDVSAESENIESINLRKDSWHDGSKPSIVKNNYSSSSYLKSDETTSEHIDDNLAKLFFEDALLHDLDPVENKQNVNPNVGQNENPSFSTPKLRKSLGGRRVIRYLTK